MGLLELSLAALNKAQPAYVTAGEYYSGEVAEHFASQRLKELLAKSGERYRINFAATPVDAVTERLEIASFMGEQQYVDSWQEAFEENEFPLEAPMVHAYAGRYGDAYVIAWLDEEMDTGVSMYVHTPLDVRVFYDPERPRKKSHAVHRWVAAGPQETPDGQRPLEAGKLYVFVNLYFPDRIERWVSENPLNQTNGQLQSATDDALLFTKLQEDELNEFGFVPVWHFRTDRPYGTPEHKDAFTPQDMVNKTLANLMSSLDFAGYPQRYAVSESANDATGGDFGAPADTGGGYTTTTDQPAARAVNPGGFKAGPGETWLVEGAKSVGTFEVMQSENFLGPVNALVKWMGTVTDTPVHLFDLGGNVPSGESIDASTEPLDKKVGNRQASYGATWRDLADGVLEMRGVTAPVGAVQVSWSPLERAVTKEHWEVVKLKVEAGVPQREALIQAGYLPEVVDSWMGVIEGEVVPTGAGDDGGEPATIPPVSAPAPAAVVVA